MFSKIFLLKNKKKILFGLIQSLIKITEIQDNEMAIFFVKASYCMKGMMEYAIEKSHRDL